MKKNIFVNFLSRIKFLFFCIKLNGDDFIDNMEIQTENKQNKKPGNINWPKGQFNLPRKI